MTPRRRDPEDQDAIPQTLASARRPGIRDQGTVFHPAVADVCEENDMTRPEFAHVVKSESTNKWYIRPIWLGFTQALDHPEAAQIAGALNAAYARGRSDVQAELRDVIGAAAQETPT
jgi:hypothetical protein